MDTDLTQQTHRRLLATLSFNNCYPSSSRSSPSISSVSSVCGFQCLSVWPSFFFSQSFFLLLCHRIQTPVPDFQQLLWLQKRLLSSPRCLAFTPLSYLLLSCSSSSSFYLFIIASAASIQRSSICCQRDSSPHKTDLFINALLPAFQIKSEKSVMLCQINSQQASKAQEQFSHRDIWNIVLMKALLHAAFV